MTGKLDEIADMLDPKDAAEIREFRDYLAMRTANAKLRETNAELLAMCQGFLHHVRVSRNGRECFCDLCVKAREAVGAKP